MGMNETPSGERLHIGFFGRRNAGKSSVVNAITGQQLAVVSDVKGTTTDPVMKAMELLPAGPVVIIDTPGFDDTGALGLQRVEKTRQALNRTDVAVLVADVTEGLSETEQQLIGMFEKKELPYIILWNKSDLLPEEKMQVECAQEKDNADNKAPALYVSALTGYHIHEAKELIAEIGKGTAEEKPLVRDLVKRGDLVILVIPIDSSAPKGRLILPQQQMIRDLLEAGAVSVCVKETELKETLAAISPKPALVITDSQAFEQVAKDVPVDIPLTSFSILMARYKGFLKEACQGAAAIDTLQEGAKILIAEGCTHHRQCEDIGTFKIPNWLRKRTGKNLQFETVSGRDFPDDVSGYDLIIHCGGCMLNSREVRYRMKCAVDQGVPITNYGTAIAHMKGILERSLRPVRSSNKTQK